MAGTLLDELFDQGGQAQSALEGRVSMTRFGLISTCGCLIRRTSSWPGTRARLVAPSEPDPGAVSSAEAT